MLIDKLPTPLKIIARKWMRLATAPSAAAARNVVRKATGSRKLSDNTAKTIAAANELRQSYVAAGGTMPRIQRIAKKRIGKTHIPAPRIIAAQWRPRALRATELIGVTGPTITARLDRMRRRDITNALRMSIGTNDETTITLTNNPAAVGLTQDQKTDYNQYRGQYRGWAMHYRVHHITAPTNWRTRVAARGLAVVDGMTTLDAAPIDAPAGVALFAATWIVQDRGHAAHSARGYIALADGMSYHGDTAEAAIAGVSRKAAAAARLAEWQKIVAAHSLESLVSAAPVAARVSVGDARRIGACDYGIRSWCAAVGLDYDNGSAPIADVLSAYKMQPWAEARAAILYALRRQRAHLKIAA